MPTVTLPTAGGALARYTMSPPRRFPEPMGKPFNRVAYAAAHVVADPLADHDPWVDVAIDWRATTEFRRHLWRLGLGVAEALDTAERGTGVDWPTALRLKRLTIEAAREFPGALVASGIGTDQLELSHRITLDDVIRAYEEQAQAVEALGGRIIMMASRALAACARSPDDYALVYGRILSQVREPVILHWLGTAFDPALTNYWGYHADLDKAMEVCLEIIAAHAEKVDGVKVSLLDKRREVAMRRRLPANVRMYTGDDFDFPELIEGDSEGHSHALLGIFGAIAPAAAGALTALNEGDVATYHAILEPTVPLSRHIFRAPTQFYRTGIVFMAFLTGHQDHFCMVGGQQSARSLVHLAEIFRLADKAGLLADPELSAARMRLVLAMHGVEG